MLTLVLFAGALAIPASTLMAWRRGGGRGLVRAVAALSALFVAGGLFLATNAGGNRLVGSYGYAYVAPRMLLAVSVELIVPTILTALVVAALGRRVPPAVAYGAAAATCILAIIFGGLAAYVVMLKLG